MERTTALRLFYARYVAACAGVTEPRIEAAFASVPREPFAGPGPWSVLASSPWRDRPRYVETTTDDPAFLYQNVLVALDPARGINIGEPSLHARCLAALAPQPGETVLQIGAGSGYYTAILAQLVGAEGRVEAFEIDPGLASRAAGNLAAWPWAQVHSRSGAADPLPAADAIYVNAGLTQPSRVWLAALNTGGRLLFPLQPIDGYGGMLLVRRPGGDASAWPARFVSRAAFIGCQAHQDDAAGSGLADAFAKGGWEAVRSLRLDGRPDKTCWFDGGDWWLSTRDPELTVPVAGR